MSQAQPLHLLPPPEKNTKTLAHTQTHPPTHTPPHKKKKKKKKKALAKNFFKKFETIKKKVEKFGTGSKVIISETTSLMVQSMITFFF